MDLDGNDVHVLVLDVVHRLLMQHLGQSRDLVAQLCRLLELQTLGVLHHHRLEITHQALRVAAQKALGVGHVALVIGNLHMPGQMRHAGTRAALDLKQQAGPIAIGKHRVLAGAQVKHLLQQQDGLFHRPGVGVGTEVAMLLLHRTPVVGDAWVGLRVRACGRSIRGSLVLALALAARHAGQLQVGVAFVVAKQDVVLRSQRLDQVVFQQQGFRLGAHYRGLHAHDLAHHVANARAAMVFLEIAGHPLAQIARLAHVQKLAFAVEVAIDARQARQGRDLREQLRRVGCIHGCLLCV